MCCPRDWERDSRFPIVSDLGTIESSQTRLCRGRTPWLSLETRDAEMDGAAGPRSRFRAGSCSSTETTAAKAPRARLYSRKLSRFQRDPHVFNFAPREEKGRSRLRSVESSEAQRSQWLFSEFGLHSDHTSRKRRTLERDRDLGAPETIDTACRTRAVARRLASPSPRSPPPSSRRTRRPARVRTYGERRRVRAAFALREALARARLFFAGLRCV